MLPDRKMKAVFSSEMLVFTYRATRCQPKDHSLDLNLLANRCLHMMRDFCGSRGSLSIVYFLLKFYVPEAACASVRGVKESA